MKVVYLTFMLSSRARGFGDTRRLTKVLVDADTSEILGAVILGLSGDEATHCLLDAMYGRKPYTVISRAVHTNPTVAELIPTMLQEMKPLEEQGAPEASSVKSAPLGASCKELARSGEEDKRWLAA